jgi:hypothetical protein
MQKPSTKPRGTRPLEGQSPWARVARRWLTQSEQSSDGAMNERRPKEKRRAGINTGEDYEGRYWSKKFGVSPEKLNVKKVGNSAAAVQQELSQ